jgi:protease-4
MQVTMQTAYNRLRECENCLLDYARKNPKITIAASLFIVGSVAYTIAKKLKNRIRKNTVLELTLGGVDVAEGKGEGLIDELLRSSKHSVVLSDIIQTLDDAAKNPHVIGIVAHITNDLRMGLAQIQEIRDAVKRFRASGKRAIAFSQSFGEWDDGKWSYYLATAFDEIYIPPSAFVGLVGLSVGHPFIKQTFEKIEATPEIGKRKKYKTFANTFTEEEMTEEEKEMIASLMTSIFEHLVSEISQDRKAPVEKIKGLFEQGPFSAAEALEAGLVDGHAYRYDLYHEILPRVFGLKEKKDMNLLFFHRYLSKVGKSKGLYYRSPISQKLTRTKGKSVGLITCEGPIHLGSSISRNMGGSPTIGADTVCTALKEAIEDPHVGVIVIRVNSRGGSCVASDLIAREVLRAKEKGKKVIVSMSDVAASGGYFISLYADQIVAEPSTLTGSIGVLLGKIVFRRTLAKLGITYDQLNTSENSKLYSSLHHFGEEGFATVDKELDRIYDDFCAKVAQGRNLSRERVEEVAQGRVWTGLEAHDAGLVDEIGGLSHALQLAREHVQVPESQLHVKIFPRGKTLVELLEEPQNSDERGPGTDGLAMTSGFGLLGLAIRCLNTLSFMARMTSALVSLLPYGHVLSSMSIGQLEQVVQRGAGGGFGFAQTYAPGVRLH